MEREDIYNLVDNFISNNKMFIYDIVFDANHEYICLVLNLLNDSSYVAILKNIKENTFLPYIFENIGASITFDDMNGFYYLPLSDT